MCDQVVMRFEFKKFGEYMQSGGNVGHMMPLEGITSIFFILFFFLVMFLQGKMQRKAEGLVWVALLSFFLVLCKLEVEYRRGQWGSEKVISVKVLSQLHHMFGPCGPLLYMCARGRRRRPRYIFFLRTNDFVAVMVINLTALGTS